MKRDHDEDRIPPPHRVRRAKRTAASGVNDKGIQIVNTGRTPSGDSVLSGIFFVYEYSISTCSLKNSKFYRFNF